MVIDLLRYLNKKGYGVVSKREHDGTATYFLSEQPKQKTYIYNPETDSYREVYI